MCYKALLLVRRGDESAGVRIINFFKALKNLEKGKRLIRIGPVIVQKDLPRDTDNPNLGYRIMVILDDDPNKARGITWYTCLGNRNR